MPPKKKSDPKKPKKKAHAAPPVKVEPFTQQLAVALKREEIEERAQRAAHLLSDRDQKEANFDEERKAQKNLISKIDVEIRSLSAEVREKVTYRVVQCERRYVYSEGIVRDIRLDTGETLIERPMSDAEKQRDLFDGKPPGDVDDEFGDPDNDDEDKEDPEAAE